MKIYVLFIFFSFSAWSFDNPSSERQYEHHTMSQNKSYGKSVMYEYLIEPFVHLDAFLTNSHFKSVHCRILETPDVVKIYEGLGSCLFEQISFVEQEKKSTVIVYTILENNEGYDFLITWKPFSIMNILSSYRDKNLKKMSNQISIVSISQNGLSEFIYRYLEILREQEMDFPIDKINVHKIDFRFQSYKTHLMSIMLNVLDSSNQNIYEIEVVTNYYIGSDDFFIMTKDRYESMEQ